MSTRTRVLATLSLLLLAACGTRGGVWDTTLVVQGPLLAASELVWLNKTAAVLSIVDPSGAHPVKGLEVSALPRVMAPTKSGLLIAGGRGDAPTLDVISLPEATRHSLHPAGAYDSIAVSPDQRYAVLFYDPSSPPAPGGPAARNNNEIGVVDLASEQITTVSLGTESVAPLGVVFSPTQPLAAVIMTAAVVFVELDHPTKQVQVPLKLPDGSSLAPAQELFSPDGRYLYVRATGSDDVLSLDVVVGSDGVDSSVNFLFFPGASGLKEIAVSSDPGFVHAVAALYSSTTSSTAVLLDATGDTSRTHFVHLAQASTYLDPLGGGMFLLSGSTATSVSGWEPLLDRSQKDILPAAPTGRPLVVKGNAFFAHAAVGTTTGTSAALTRVSVADDGSLLRVQQSPIVLGGTPGSTTVDPVSGKVLISVSIPRAGSGAGPILGKKDDFSGNTASIVTIDPVSLALGGLVLDAEVVSLGVANGQVFALHAGSLGDVTFFPASNPTRSLARRVVGFLTAHLFDLGEKA
jgi:hypothetical protein